MTHELKILPEYYDAVLSGVKNFEIRKNDRNYHVGDKLILQEYQPNDNMLIDPGYTGRQLERWVGYILYDWQVGLKDGYCIMALKRSAPMKGIDGDF